MLHRDLCFDRVIFSLYACIRHIEQTGRRQRLNIGVDIPVITTQSLSKRTNAGNFVPSDVTQQFEAFARQRVGKRVPAFEREVAFLKNLSLFRPMPSINEPTSGLILDRAAHRDFEITHHFLRTANRRPGFYRLVLSYGCEIKIKTA